jgi:LDH2 family malate/lactate/ureidoglycolate dehydrogenase
MYEDCCWLDVDFLRNFMRDVFMGLGVPAEDALICAQVLITADQRGIDSHGIGRLKPIYYDRIRQGIQQAVTQFEVVKEGPVTAVVDGHNGMGHVIGHRSMQLAVEKARHLGMGMVAV